MNPRAWLRQHSLKLLAITDRPEAIAGGVAIGIFFGFTPLFGLKTILSILVCWLTGCNILAAVIAGTLHEALFPVMPVIYYYQYCLGHWLLTQPHEWPHAFHRAALEKHAWRSWTAISSIGKPMLLGSILTATPLAAVCYWAAREILARHRRKKTSRPSADEAPREPG